MTQGKEVAQFLLEDGTPFLIEIDKVPNRSPQRISRGGAEPDIVQAGQTFEKALDQAIPVARAALNRIRSGLTTPADEVELKFGLKLTAETGAIIASVGGEVNFEITLKWKHEKAG